MKSESACRRSSRGPSSRVRSAPRGGDKFRRLVHGDVEAISRKPVAGALGPFDDGHRGQEIVEAELGKLTRLEP